MAKKTTKKKASKKVSYTRSGYKVSKFGVALKPGTDRDCIATWKFSKANWASGFSYDWEYKVGARWLPGSSGTIDITEASVVGGYYRHEWRAPDEATMVMCHVKPNSKSRNVKVNKKSVSKPYFTSVWSAKRYHDLTKDKLPTPEVDVDLQKNGVTADIDVKCDDEDCNYATIIIYDPAGKEAARHLRRCDQRGEYSYTLGKGSTWGIRVFCTTDGGKKGKSELSDIQHVTTIPADAGAVAAKATGDDSAQATWDSVAGATSYTVEYTADDPSYFDTNPGEVKSQDDIVGTTFNAVGLESGHTWYFRVRGDNDTGHGKFGEPGGTVLATVPDAPTTFETEPAYMTSETARLRWTHNSEDESDQTAAEVRFKVGEAETVTALTEDMYLDKEMSDFSDGDSVQWSVRTKGAHPDWSPWSLARTFGVYSQPELSCTVRQTDASGDVVDEDNPLTSLPLAIILDASGGGNSVSGYHVSIVAAEPLGYTDEYGYERNMAVGELAWEADFSTDDDPFTVVVGPGEQANIRDSGVYKAIADVSMESGLRAVSDPWTFQVDFDGSVPEPDATVAFDPDDLVATIMPACYERDSDGNVTDTLVQGVLLSVYRIDDDGTLVPLRTGIANTGNAVVSDPHAQFNECWYHIVATDPLTNACSFYDTYDVSDHNTCVIQWDEGWQVGTDPDDLSERDYSYTGLRIDGLYNLGLDETGNAQAEDVEYIGREYPVSYYGTQKGYEASYAVEFPKTDLSTLDKARRLIVLRDDVYVREPFGAGYWAHIVSPTISRTSDSLKLRLSFTARRVDRSDAALEEE